MTCKIGSNRNLDSNNLCPCAYGYHDENSTLLTCLKCAYSCLTCSNNQTCITCYPGRISVTNSLCSCPVNRYYDDGSNGACIPCHYSCLTCQSSSNNCTSCSTQNRRTILNNKCPCDIGYFDNSV
jgi:proprotein convertase subtilisin/kexin type 5